MTQTGITFIYAQDRHGAIGYKNQLPWHLPSDLKFFKEQTMGHTILMGRKTFESMGKRLLPGRTSVVWTRQAHYGNDIERLQVVHSVADILELAKEQALIVIGGSEVFQQLLPYATRIVRTVIDDTFKADVFMPEIDTATWRLEKMEQGTVNDTNLYKHRFEWWQKIENQH